MRLAFYSFIVITMVIVLPKVQAQSEIARYYHVELQPNADMPAYEKTQLDSIQMAHMANIKLMAERGKLMVAGPFKEGGGLFILNVKSKEEAEQLCEKDPAVKAGKFSYLIKEWYTEKGLFTLENKN
ncbi:MAG: YciI family protein [Fulvivirga sp.]|uniref:YciI family protein n=1 Tax=Fulvivirga sp. TaxID=1931237 RepID=UPI0032EB5868